MSQSDRMSQWEYRTINISDVPRKMLATDLLNDLGQDSWELVCIGSNGVAYLKRELAPSSARRRVRGGTRPPDAD
jgi:hypothetical protein